MLLTGFLIFRLTREEPEVHLHAGFQVYVDNQLQDYSTLEYMHIAPCSEEGHEEELTSEKEQEEKAHLHDNVGDVVHVHRAGVVWADLFKNIKVEIDPNAKAFINGQETRDFLNSPINAYDSLVIFLGENTDLEQKLAHAVTRGQITEAEGASENCGS